VNENNDLVRQAKQAIRHYSGGRAAFATGEGTAGNVLKYERRYLKVQSHVTAPQSNQELETAWPWDRLETGFGNAEHPFHHNRIRNAI
jgi:hypothetical protein